MDFLDVIQKRYSCRKYKSDSLPKELIEKVMDIARKAPSAHNKQPWKFIAVIDSAIRQKLGEAYNKDWFIQAPAIIVACGVVEQGWKRKWDSVDYTEVDVAIAFDHLTLAATNEGLGTCWIGAFQEDVVRRVLHIPDGVKIIAMTPLGYPNDTNPNKPRKNLSEVLCWGKWE
jgi:nitroreductase